MIWIVLIIAAIAGKFIYDRYNLLNDISSKGGLIIKYKTLIDYMLIRSNGTITSNGRDHIEINYGGAGVVTYFSIVPGFGKVIVQWQFKCEPLGSLKHKWEFDEKKVSQLQMVEEMERDIDLKSKPFMDFSNPVEVDIHEEGRIDLGVKPAVSHMNVNELLLKNDLKKNTILLFIQLDRLKQAQVLSLFMQINHNNTFVDNLYYSNQALFMYDEYENGYDYFVSLLELGVENVLQSILLIIIDSISKPSELYRLSATLHAVHENLPERNNYIELATKSWEKTNLSEARYVYNLFKAKVDLLIYSNEYFDAATMCESIWALLHSEKHTQNIGWIKYQFAKTIVILSKHIKINLSVNEIFESLEELEESALSENI